MKGFQPQWSFGPNYVFHPSSYELIATTKCISSEQKQWGRRPEVHRIDAFLDTIWNKHRKKSFQKGHFLNKNHEASLDRDVNEILLC